MNFDFITSHFKSSPESSALPSTSITDKYTHMRSLKSADKFKQIGDEIRKHFFNADGSLIDSKYSISESWFLYVQLIDDFRQVEFESTDTAWIQRADILDAIYTLQQFNSQLPHVIARDAPGTPEWKKGTVPLVSYRSVKAAETAFKNLGDDRQNKSAEALGSQRSLPVEGEYTKTAKVVQFLTQRHSNPILAAISWIAKQNLRLSTVLVGIVENRPLSGYKARRIAHFSRKMGIQSVEVVPKKINGKYIYTYRSTRELFGHSLHDYKSKNEWFARDLSPKARSEYLKRYFDDEDKLDKKYGIHPQDASREVISNAFCRIRETTLEPGKFGDMQVLTGKVLNKDAEDKAQTENDEAAYYVDKYSYSNKNLFGREVTDPIEPIIISDDAVGKIKTDIKGKEKKAMDEVIVSAQHQLLGQMYRVLNRTGAVQVIQRLAPADIHNYVKPLNGTPLSHKEAVEALQTYIEGRKTYLENEQSTSEEIAQLETDIAQCEQLKAIFEEQEKVLKRPSQATIDLLGTVESVSTTGILNQARILAQNDRKVMMFKHFDGSFSFHVFIGATGVNKVNIDQKVNEQTYVGQRQGDMQFGVDEYKEEGEKPVSQKMTKDDHPKLRLGKGVGEKGVGETIDTFPINGSTVISFYLPLDFSVLPKIENFKNEAYYGENKTEVEIKANMGDPLLRKTEILAAEIIERALSDEFNDPSTTMDIILDNLPHSTLPIPEEGTKFDRNFEYDSALLDKVKLIATKENRSYEEHLFLENLKATIQSRLDVIHHKQATDH